ncbi:MAG: PQQ-like beta-propeller repeat protein [Acidobacteriota bacterium]|nr:PQQ-like beta-propeller repeat protein [Acidobacteriota bacterium]MDQ3418315.1 PQQ-like beta-propeller repeat protein [Acidobacteriota bacterium]
MKNARFALPLFVTAIGVLSVTVDVSNRTLDDWPQWRGKNRDGIATEKGLLKTWPAAGPPLAWKTTGAGEGYSSFSAAHGRLYTMGARGGTEFVMAFDAATGKKLWERESGRRFSNDQGDGPRGTPVVDGTQLYSLGASGDLTSIDSATGKVAWTINVLQKFGGSNIRWGLSESPLVLQDRILVNAGGRGASIVAIKKTDGSEIWRSGDDEAGYSSAVSATVGGIPMAVFFTDAKALGVDTRDGRHLWSYARAANRTANIATPIIRGNKVFISSDYRTGAGLVELTASGKTMTAKEIYFTNEMRNHHASSILIGDHLYGFSSAILTAMKFDDGQVAWKDRSVGKGSMVFADDRLYLYSERGTVAIAEANPAAYKEHGRFQLTVGSSPTWSHPVIANGKLFLRDQDNIYAYDVRAK